MKTRTDVKAEVLKAIDEAFSRHWWFKSVHVSSDVEATITLKFEYASREDRLAAHLEKTAKALRAGRLRVVHANLADDKVGYVVRDA